MKNISLFIALTLLFACQSEVKVDTTDVDEKFAKNCLTVKSYLDDFVKESVDYDKRIKIYKLSENFQKVMIQWINELKDTTSEIE